MTSRASGFNAPERKQRLTPWNENLTPAISAFDELVEINKNQNNQKQNINENNINKNIQNNDINLGSNTQNNMSNLINNLGNINVQNSEHKKEDDVDMDKIDKQFKLDEDF